MNGIELILLDHQRADELFERFEATGDATCVGLLVDALTTHDEAEQHALYPLALLVLGPEAVDGPMLAHAQTKMLLERVRYAEGQELTRLMAELATAVRAHVADEQERLLPALVEAASPAQLEGLGARIEQVKQRVG